MAQSSVLRNLFKDANLKLQKEWLKYVFVSTEKVADFHSELLEFLTQKSNAQRDEMVYFIWDTFDVFVSKSCIGRLLRKKKWTKKVVLFS